MLEKYVNKLISEGYSLFEILEKVSKQNWKSPNGYGKFHDEGGIPFDEMDDLLEHPQIREKFRQLRVQVEPKFYKTESNYFHDAVVTLVFSSGYTIEDLAQLSPTGIIKMYVDGQDINNWGKPANLSNYVS